MSRTRPRVTVGLASLTLLISAGCGGTGGSGERLSEAEWIARADVICAEGAAQLEALGVPESAEELAGVSPQEFVDLMSRTVEIGEEQLDALRQLNPPAEALADYEQLLELTEQQVQITRDLKKATEEGDTGAVPGLLQEREGIEQQADAIIAKYPFEQCGRN